MLACAALAQGVAAQHYPSKIIKLVNPYAAGGPFDSVARNRQPAGRVARTTDHHREPAWRRRDDRCSLRVQGSPRLSRPIVNTVYEALAKVMGSPQIKKALQDQQGAEVTMLAPDEFATHLQKERGELVGIIRAIQLKVD